MDINLNTSAVGNTAPFGGLDDVSGAKGGPASILDGDGVTISASSPEDVDGVSETVERSLVRDDALGNLFSSAFDLAPPPMPTFGE